MRTIYLLVCLSLYGDTCAAQKIKTVEAIRQDWSGGIAGRHGSNYHFVIQFTGTKADIVLDTIWIGADPVALVEKGKGGYENYTVKKKGCKATFEITVQISKDDYRDRYPTNIKDDPRGKPPTPPIKYTGVALISYKLKGETRYYTITKTPERKPSLNYP